MEFVDKYALQIKKMRNIAIYRHKKEPGSYFKNPNKKRNQRILKELAEKRCNE